MEQLPDDVVEELQETQKVEELTDQEYQEQKDAKEEEIINEIAEDVQVSLEPWVYEEEVKKHEIVDFETEEDYINELELEAEIAVIQEAEETTVIEATPNFV